MATLQSKLILTLQDQVSGRMRAMSAQIAAFRSRMRAATMPVMGMTTRLAALGGGYLGATAGARGTVGAAIKFEEAFADVRKVLDATPEQMDNIRRQVLNMSKVLPTSAEGIASIYAAAAQSNIPIAELGKFSEMVAKVSVAWDTTEADTSQALAEIKTQLNMGVDEIGLYADAINHLSNNTPARAAKLVEFSRRVAAQGEMFGFSAQESLAFGSAMVSMGAEAEIAATSFRNMGKALTRGAGTKKEALRGWKRVGLDPKVVAKEMQKDAAKTTMKVIEAVQKVAKHERADIAFALFGEEARALMPVINDAKELRRQMDEVGRETNYAGSAFKEYMERANTTSNVLAIMRNRIRAIGIEMGTKWLPTIKEVAIAFSDVFDSMGDRVTPFKRMETAIKGFMQGLGYDGGIKEMVDDLADLFFGKIDPSEGADKLGQLFVKMESWGKAVREFSDAIKDNPVVKFIAELAGHGFKLMLATMGLGLLAGAVMKLGRAMMFLSGASAAIAILKTLAGVGGAIFGAAGKAGMGGKGGKGGETKSGKPGKPGKGGKVPAVGVPPAVGGFLRGGLLGVPLAALGLFGSSMPSDEREKLWSDFKAANRRHRDTLAGSRGGEGPLTRGRGRSGTASPGQPLVTTTEPVLHPSLMNENLTPAGGTFDRMLEGMKSLMPQQDPTPTLREILGAVHQPSGTQQVREINPTPVHAPVNVTVYATTNADPNQIAAQVGAKVQDTIAGYYGTSAYG